MTETAAMLIFVGGLAVLCGAGVLCACLGSRPATGWLAFLGALVGCLAAGGVGGWALLAGRSFAVALAWQGVPFCTVRLGLDPLSGFFTVVVALLGFLGALYGQGYWAPGRRRGLGLAWGEYLWLVAAMLAVVAARDGLFFLVAWEVMSLASFLLVIFERERRETLEAGWIYLAAAHLGAACLLAMFLVLGRGAGSMDFADLGRGLAPGAASAVFVLALLGFGSKAGFVPLHVWLPEAHPAAPSHVSALMSGVMIKMGIYGILRVVWLVGAPAAWWGWALLAVGAVSGVLGVLLALAQQDLKRLLAYSSVENVGIVALGLGLGLVGWHVGSASLAALGLAAALLHVLNHAVFKGLLFLAAGSVLHATGTREMDRLGGLLRRMPATGALFLLGSAAIAGLPPLNGFVSEFPIYLASFREVASETAPLAGRAAGLVALTALSLIGGLACACFAKAAGTVFLGEPRDESLPHAHDAGGPMLAAMGVLGALCVAIGLGGPLVLRGVWNAVLQFPLPGPQTPVEATVHPAVLAGAVGPLAWVSACGGGVLILVLLAALVRWVLLRGKPRGEAGTWDCGYAAPTARMQYTGSSFSDPLVALFRPVLRTRTELRAPEGFFPRGALFRSRTGDLFRSGIFRPVFRLVEALSVRLRPLQQGRVQVYVLYLAATLLILLAWKLR